MSLSFPLAIAGALLSGVALAADAPTRTSAEILAATTAADWRRPDPAHTLYVELPSGRVVIELAPAFAPRHVANIEALARAHYFDGLPILRAQDNYVVQWGDPEEEPARRRSLGAAQPRLTPEWGRPLAPDLPFRRLPDGDVYAPEVGYSQGFPAARDPAAGQAWLCHCYGMVGVGRDEAVDSGSGAALYVVIGHAPRHLDRNVTLVGRVIHGIERLATLPRGSQALGFYASPAQYTRLARVRLAADVPPAERTALEVLRTDTATFGEYVESRRTRRESWFADPVGRVELCNVPVPVRPLEGQ